MMNTNRTALVIVFLTALTATFTFEKSAYAQSTEQKDANQKDEKQTVEKQKSTRIVKIIAPSISCFGRFEDGLKQRIRDKNDWVHSVKVKNLYKRILEPRPEFDFGHDVEIEFRIDKNRSVRELAEAMIKQGFSGNSVLTEGHKMSDYKNIQIKKLIKNAN